MQVLPRIVNDHAMLSKIDPNIITKGFDCKGYILTIVAEVYPIWNVCFPVNWRRSRYGCFVQRDVDFFLFFFP